MTNELLLQPGDTVAVLNVPVVGPFMLLIKGQLLRESASRFDQFYQAHVDRDFVNYLKHQDRLRIEAIENDEQADAYIGDTRRMSLVDWLLSLTWDHVRY